MSTTVSIHPYFRAHEGKLEEFKALFPRLIETTGTEEGCLWYDFSISGDGIIHCREAYRGAAGLLAHLANCESLLGEVMAIAELVRLEVHGPAEELAQLKEALGGLNPEYFEFHSGLGRP